MAYSRILLKLSGEAIEGKDNAFDSTILDRLATEIHEAAKTGIQVGVVIGGGNLFRGMTGTAAGMDRTAADTMGMLATIMNCVALQDALVRAGQRTVVLSAIPVMQVCEPFTKRQAVSALENGRVVLMGGGTGNPYFTTDTAAALRALEIGAEAVLKATKVDGIYDKDPNLHSDAKQFSEVSFTEVLERDLKVMDATAVALCRDNRLPIAVFNMTEPGNIVRVARGENVGSRVVADR